MADPKDRNIEDRFDDSRRAAGADANREGYGDDGGTRVGRPDPGRRADAGSGPSSQPVKEGLEGGVFEGEGGANTGAGGEAAQGIHDANEGGSPRGGTPRRGSEPLEGREQEQEEEGAHASGYVKEEEEEEQEHDQTTGIWYAFLTHIACYGHCITL